MRTYTARQIAEMADYHGSPEDTCQEDIRFFLGWYLQDKYGPDRSWYHDVTPYWLG